VVARLERLAAQTGMSLNGVAVRELASASRWMDSAALLEALPHLDVDVATIVADLDHERGSR
jgi:hypothetical protein